MKSDVRLSSALHGLLHIADAKGPVTSQELAQKMRTNSVVVRRLLAGLREQGIVRSEKGHGGGWTLSADLEAVTLEDVYRALESPRLFSMSNKHDSPGCLMERAVNAVLDGAFDDAETLILARMRSVSLAALVEDFRVLLSTTQNARKREAGDRPIQKRRRKST